MSAPLELVIITGMSGAGKTVALQSFEDMGYYCVDNLPPSLIPTFWDLLQKQDTIQKVCLVIDLRSRQFFKELQDTFTTLQSKQHIKLTLIYLDASDQAVVSRYKETRRNHPLQQAGGTILSGIEKERSQLEPIRAQANLIIDTTSLRPRELRDMLIREYQSAEHHIFMVEMISFGFKYGLPLDADIVMDVRFLPNPHYVDDLRPLTGLDVSVYNYVMAQHDTEVFYQKLIDLLDFTLPRYEREGKASLSIAIGCTGGQHRSVALTERVGQHIEEAGYQTHTSHRDINKRRKAVTRS